MTEKRRTAEVPGTVGVIARDSSRTVRGQVIGIKPRESLDLDLLELLPKSDAADVVSTLANIPCHLYGELASLVKKHNSI